MIQSAEFALLSLLQIFTNVIIIISIIITENRTKMKINQGKGIIMSPSNCW